MKLTALLFAGSVVVAAAQSQQAVERSFESVPAGATDLVPRVHETPSAGLNAHGIEHTTTVTFNSTITLIEPTAPTRQPAEVDSSVLKLSVTQIPYAESLGKKPEYVLLMGNLAYRSIEELKKGVSRLPKGTRITWAPSCCLTGGEPLHNEEGFSDLRDHCREKGIEFVVIPSG